MEIWQKQTRDGMLKLVSQNRNYIETTNLKLKRIHEEYIRKNQNLYSEDELRWINHYLNSIIYKLFLVRVSIEHLQTIRYGRIEESLWPAIENSLFTLCCSEDEQVLVSFALEAFLFEARSFLDIFMIFVCLLLKTGFTNGLMDTGRFYKELGNVEDALFDKKALWVKDYFENNVFGLVENPNESVFRNDWGSLLVSLRDRIAHRDTLSLSFQSKEKFVDGIRLDWLTVKGLTYHSLAETIGNEIHSLFYKCLCHIYEINWDISIISSKR